MTRVQTPALVAFALTAFAAPGEAYADEPDPMGNSIGVHLFTRIAGARVARSGDQAPPGIWSGFLGGGLGTNLGPFYFDAELGYAPYLSERSVTYGFAFRLLNHKLPVGFFSQWLSSKRGGCGGISAGLPFGNELENPTATGWMELQLLAGKSDKDAIFALIALSLRGSVGLGS